MVNSRHLITFELNKDCRAVQMRRMLGFRKNHQISSSEKDTRCVLHIPVPVPETHPIWAPIPNTGLKPAAFLHQRTCRGRKGKQANVSQNDGAFHDRSKAWVILFRFVCKTKVCCYKKPPYFVWKPRIREKIQLLPHKVPSHLIAWIPVPLPQ